MLNQPEDPFHYLLAQKIKTLHNSTNKLNLNKLPDDFFRKPTPKNLAPSQRSKDLHFNEFMAYNKTVELRRPQYPGSFSRANSKQIVSKIKRELTAPSSKRPEHRRFTEFKEEPQGFNCTFARKLYSEASEQKKLHFPSLQSARRNQKLKIEIVL